MRYFETALFLVYGLVGVVLAAMSAPVFWTVLCAVVAAFSFFTAGFAYAEVKLL